MSQNPKSLRYTKTHEWDRNDSGTLTVGITDYAQDQMGELTYVELPKKGDSVNAEDEVAVVESVKAASDIYAPVSGTVVEVNSKLIDQPDLINEDPFGDGWMFRLEPDDVNDLDTLMDAASYEELLPEEED